MVAYIVVEMLTDGPRVTDHASKKSAHTMGMAARRQGIVAFAYPAAEAMRLGLDPRRK